MCVILMHRGRRLVNWSWMKMPVVSWMKMPVVFVRLSSVCGVLSGKLVVEVGTEPVLFLRQASRTTYVVPSLDAWK